MKIEPNQIFEVSGYEMFFDGECKQSLKNIAEKLGEGCDFHLDSYSITANFSQIILVPVNELGVLLGMLRQNGVALTHSENCKYSGSELNIVNNVRIDQVAQESFIPGAASHWVKSA